MLEKTLHLLKVIVVAFIFTGPAWSQSKQTIEGEFICSIELNNILALRAGRIIADGTLTNFDYNHLSINYELVPLQGMNSAWIFNIKIEGNDFERLYNIPIGEKLISKWPSSPIETRELIVRDTNNEHGLLNLSENILRLANDDFFIVMKRYYKNDWEAFSTEFNLNDQGMYKIALALDCRNKSDQIDQIINEVLKIYE